jgi:hypothetical protein
MVARKGKRGWHRYPKLPHAPKPPRTAYVHFINDRKHVLIATKCGGVEIMRILGRAWSELAPDDKHQYKVRPTPSLC